MSETRVPLSPGEEFKATHLLGERENQARKFTRASALPSALFLVGVLAQSFSRRGPERLQIQALAAGLVVLIAFLIWHFGWKRVLQLRADLKGGHKHHREGLLTAVDSQDSAYGETITWLTVDGLKVVARDPALASARKGQRAVIDYLPSSRMVLAAQVQDP